MKIKLNECDKSDRQEIANIIANEFGGRVPMEEAEFVEVITQEKADEVLKDVLAVYVEATMEVEYTPHDLFVLYEDIMR